MVTDLRTSLLAASTAFACVVIVVAKVATAQGPTVKRSATPSERAEIAQTIATNEKAWTDESTQAFPEDHWSQRDDFHGHELQQVLKTANEKGIRVEDVLRTIDEDIHRRSATRPDAPDARHAHAIPCKPRPFYD
jgi:hypothetical protein